MKSILVLLLINSIYQFISSIFLLISTDVIALLGQVFTGIVTLCVAYMAYKTNQKMHKMDTKVDTLGTSIDGMKSELVSATKIAGEGTGNLKGREEMAKEQAPIIAEKVEAAKAEGNLIGRQELKDESKKIIPK